MRIEEKNNQKRHTTKCDEKIQREKERWREREIERERERKRERESERKKEKEIGQMNVQN